MNISIPYPGGKYRIWNKLAAEFPRFGNKYLELFAGRGNMFFNFKYISDYEKYHINDKYTGKYFRAIQVIDLNNLPKVITYELYEDLKMKFLMNDPLALVLEPHITFRGKGYDAGPQFDQGHFERYDFNRFKQKLAFMKARLIDVTVTDYDFTHVDLDNLTCDDFIYCDPPYLYTEGVGYNNIDHMELINILQNTDAQWALSGYETEMYLHELGEPILRLERNIEMSNESNQSIECLWRS